MKKGIAVVLLATLISTLCWTGASAQITFLPDTLYTGPHLHLVVSADIDGDNDDDLIGATVYSADTSTEYKLYTWINSNGNMVASPPVSILYGGYFNRSANAIVSADIDTDGLDEIYLASGDSLKIFKWNGINLYKTFTAYTGDLADGIAVGDVDADGFQDIVVTHWISNWFTVLYGNGATWSASGNSNYTLPAAGNDQVIIGKLGNDTVNSIVYMRGQTFQNDIEIIKINANRTTSPYIPLNLNPTNLASHAVAIGDVDADGINELVSSYGLYPSCGIAVWDTFTPNAAYRTIPTSDGLESIIVTQIDNCPEEEIVVTHGSFINISINTDTVASIFPVPYAGHSPSTGGIDNGDFNLDGLTDIVLAGYNGLLVLYNTTVFGPVMVSVTSDTSTIGPVSYTDTLSMIVTTDTIGDAIIITTVTDTCYYVITRYQVENDTVTVECGDTTVSSVLAFYADTLVSCGTIVTTDTVFTVDTYSVLIPNVFAYPNPTPGMVRVHDMANATVTVVNALGQRLSPPIVGNEVDLSGFPPGLYLFSITTPSGMVVTTLKVVKQ